MAGYALMLVSLLFHGSMAGFWVLTIGFMCANFGQYGYYLIMMIAILNTVEYNEYKHGARDEAIIASLRPFLTKMSSAVIVLITTVTYILFGVTTYTNQISSLESSATAGTINEAEKLAAIDQVVSAVNSSQTTGLLLVMVLLSAVLMGISYYLYVCHYTLDETEYERICSELDARHGRS